ncbi:MAG: hypothetical protein WC988_04625 [Patescibacteria group bacterium]
MESDIKKFSEAEIILGGLFTLTIDGISAILDAFAVGLVISPVIQSGVTFSMWMWFKSKGDKTSGDIGKQVAKYAANALPIIPTTFVVFVVSAYVHNHPKIAGKIATKTAGLKPGAAKI